jgi:hypothetical protein
MSDTKRVPTLFEWMGGMPAIERLFEVFYSKVPREPLLSAVFAEITPEHSKHVAAFVAEVLGGPKAYSAGLGGHPHMIPPARGPGIDRATAQARRSIRNSDPRSSRTLNGEHAWRSSTRNLERRSTRPRRCPSGAGEK